MKRIALCLLFGAGLGVPQPGHVRGSTRSAEEYGYKTGAVLPSSGIVRVTVSSEKAVVEYVKTDTPVGVAHPYSCPSR